MTSAKPRRFNPGFRSLRACELIQLEGSCKGFVAYHDGMNPHSSHPSRPTAGVAPSTLPAVGDPPPPAAAPQPPPRLRRADRSILVPAMPLDDLLTPEHHARIVGQFVQGLDLTPLLAPIRSVEGGPGRPAIDPHILVALWLLATVEGIGSARALDWLCGNHHGFRWLCGGVAVNDHTLSDFRVGHLDFLDQLLSHSVATLMEQALVDLNRVAQDGLRVRASAGAASCRRRPTLEQCLHEAQTQVQRLRAELEADPGEGTRQQRQAQERAARDRAERVRQALARMPELEAKKKAADQGKARAATTDPEATVLKMADGGFRPACNVQFSTDTASQIIVGVAVTTRGTDAGQMPPMVAQIEGRYQRVPAAYLVDGGFAAHEDIEAVSRPGGGTTVYAPVPKPRVEGVDRYAPHRRDSAPVAAWRQRMARPEARVSYKERAAAAECVNALARNRGLRQFLVRGLAKVKAIALW
jgi:transposase